MPTIDEQRDASLTGVLTSPPAAAPADASLRRWVHDACETTAALLLASAPAVAAPEDSWAGIRSALILRRQQQAWRKKLRTTAAWGGWAAAACLAVALFMPGESRTSGGEGDDATTSQVPSTLRPPDAESGDVSRGGGSLSGDDHHSTDGVADGGSPRGLHKQVRPPKDYQLVQSLDRLRDEVSRLRAGDAERYESRDGVARVVVMELNGQPAAGTPARQPRLTSDKLSDIVAAGLSGKSGETPPSSEVPPADGSTPPEKRPITLRPGDTWNGEFVVPAGEPLPDFGLLNLPPGVTIRYGSLPLEDPVWAENFHPVTGTADTWYDVRNDVIWSPSNDHPGEFTGRRPGTEFNKDTYTLQPDSPPPPPATSGQTSTPLNDGNSYSAWTIFDETTGRGSIIVEEMAPAPEGMVYRLSFEDTAHGRTVQVGDLPELESGSGRVQFEVGASGHAPSSWQLQLVDRSTGAATPVLQGPGSR